MMIGIGLLVLLALLTSWWFYRLVWGTPPDIHQAVERLGIQSLWQDPETLTSLGMVDNTLLDFHSGRLTDASPRFMVQKQRSDRKGLALIRQYDPKQLDGQKKITAELMRWHYQMNLQGHRFDYHWQPGPVFMGPYPVNHVYGVHIELIDFLSYYHQIQGHRSIRRYQQRLTQVGWKINGLIENLNIQASMDVLPPRFVLEKSLSQINQFTSQQVIENPLFVSFVKRMKASHRLSSRAQLVWQENILRTIQNDVLPAYVKLGAYIQEMLTRAPEEDGIWRLPAGEEYYAFLLRMHTTTCLSAKDIHQLGLAEVARLTESARQALSALGHSEAEVGIGLQRLREDPHHYYADGDDARDLILQDYQMILEQANARMDELFSYGPLDQIKVQRLPAYLEPDSPVAYAQAPSLDGRRSGTMLINLRHPEHIYRWGMPTLAYHEGIPGHIYQISQAQKIKGLPVFRRTFFFNAYTEGWALYAEHLGWELGLEDPLANLGRLQALLWRAARLVVDTGIHAYQWTRQEAMDYMLEKTGLPERDLVSEVERYIVSPGQACAYYIGYLKILELRRKAEATLGEAFHLQDFHDVIIQNGGLPLPLLESVVNTYIDRTAGFSPPLQ